MFLTRITRSTLLVYLWSCLLVFIASSSSSSFCRADSSGSSSVITRWLNFGLEAFLSPQQQKPATTTTTEAPEPKEKSSQAFEIYWNVPSFMCHKYGMDFHEVSKKYSILQNDADDFRGNRIAILYDPGDFPAFLKDDRDNIVKRNGGVPQEGNLSLHLDYFRHHLAEQLPSTNFSGIGVIDFESWRPIFRQNWASLQIYRDLSIDLERQRHPFWSPKAVQQEAEARFERAGKLFMQKTLDAARRLRPKAVWGYYAYPYCFNWTPSQQSAQCVPKVIEENDQMTWLFGNAKVLLPSVYLSQKLTSAQKIGLVRGRIQEAVRLARKSQSREPTKVYAYYWYKYQDQRNSFIEKRELVGTIMEISRRGADGMILWGSSADLDTEAKCNDFRDYLHEVLGPTLLRVQRQINNLV
ncbi:hypothetical protein TKK_0019382 [Trichogramma kaykai]